MNDAREFSIPLAKRGMYRPSRKARKAADTTQRAREEDWIPKPDVEPQAGEERVPPIKSAPVVDEPGLTTEPDEIVVIPDVPEPVARPVEDGSRTRGNAPSKDIKALRKELKALRAELDGVQIDRSDQPPAEPAPSFPVGFRPGSGREPDRPS
jgi:hypothetical protein